MKICRGLADTKQLYGWIKELHYKILISEWAQ